MVALVLEVRLLLAEAGGAVVVAGLNLGTPVTGKMVLQSQTTHQAAVPALVAVVVEVHILIEVVGIFRHIIEIRALAMAVEPVAAIHTHVAEATELLAAEAERGHDGHQEIVVGVLVVLVVNDMTRLTIVFLRPVQFGTHTQPVVEVVLPHQTEVHATAVLIHKVGHVLFVNGRMVVGHSYVGTHTPLGKGQRRQHQCQENNGSFHRVYIFN